MCELTINFLGVSLEISGQGLCTLAGLVAAMMSGPCSSGAA